MPLFGLGYTWCDGRHGDQEPPLPSPPLQAGEGVVGGRAVVVGWAAGVGRFGGVALGGAEARGHRALRCAPTGLAALFCRSAPCARSPFITRPRASRTRCAPTGLRAVCGSHFSGDAFGGAGAKSIAAEAAPTGLAALLVGAHLVRDRSSSRDQEHRAQGALLRGWRCLWEPLQWRCFWWLQQRQVHCLRVDRVDQAATSSILMR